MQLSQRVLIIPVVVVGLVLICVGCAPSPPPLTTSQPPPIFPTSTPGQAATQPLLVSPVAISTPTPVDPVSVAISALSKELNVPPSSIQYVDAEATEWQDTSLGCPKPDRDYLQVITPGMQIRLVFGEVVYMVHTDLAGTAVVCSTEGGQAVQVSDPIVAEFIAQAKADLADLLLIDERQIDLVRADGVEWTDARLGCDLEIDVTPVPTTGYRIILAVGSNRYEYHTDQQRMVRCEQPIE